MEHFVSIDQLQVGIYIQLDLRWMDHPFGFGSFKIKSAEQIQTLRQLGLDKIRYDPNRSDVKPLPVPEVAAPRPAVAVLAEDAPLLQEKRARIERLKLYRQEVAATEKAFLNAARTASLINTNLLAQPKIMLAEAEAFIEQLAKTFLADQGMTIHAMGGNADTTEHYYHGLNVTVLSLIVAKALDLSLGDGKVLGMGALFHDLGLKDIPTGLRRKRDGLTPAEDKLRQMHCDYGVNLGMQIGLRQAELNIIGQHHELMDGSGYPKKLRGDEIDPLARIVEVANCYDSLCNPAEAGKAMCPHEVLSLMFAQQRSKHDQKTMNMLVRCLGIYPPGTFVLLSNGAIGMVTSVNQARPLKPTLIVYDANIPKEEAIILDLEDEPDVHISNAFRPSQLPRPTIDYLSMRKHISYYFHAAATG